MMIEPDPTDVMPTMNPATAPRMMVGIGRGDDLGSGHPRRALAEGQSVLPHLEQRPRHQPGGRQQQRQPEQRLERRVELLAARLEADEPGAEERRGHRPDAQQLDQLEVDRRVPQVNECARRLHHEARDEVAGDRGQRVGTEEEDEHRRHQRAAAHPREPDDDPDEQPADGERQVNGHAVTRSCRDGEHRAMIPSASRPKAIEVVEGP